MIKYTSTNYRQRYTHTFAKKNKMSVVGIAVKGTTCIHCKQALLHDCQSRVRGAKVGCLTLWFQPCQFEMWHVYTLQDCRRCDTETSRSLHGEWPPEPFQVHLILIRTICLPSVCRQRAMPCNCLYRKTSVGFTPNTPPPLNGCLHVCCCPGLPCSYRMVLHDGGDVADWRALAGVFEIFRPVNNPPPTE